MQMLLYAVLGMLMVGALMTVPSQLKMDAPANVVETKVQVDRYRLFMYVASQYMSSYSGGAATIPWATLKTVSTAPSGAVNSNMPGTWKVVVASDKSWVACTDLDEKALGMLQQLATPKGATLNQTQIANQSYVVIGSSSDISKAQQCL